MSYPDHSRDEAATFDAWWDNFSRKENLISPFPYCCRYKERGVMYCHNGHDCVCYCHGIDAPHTKASVANAV